jgi:hypothetical protein
MAALTQAIQASLAPEFARLSTRLDMVERAPTLGGRYESDSDSYVSSDAAEHRFVPLTSLNPHWVAKHFKDDVDQQPRKQNLHTYPPWDTLTGKDSRHERGGALGASLSYMEPCCAYMWEALHELVATIGQLELGHLTSRLKEIWATLHEMPMLVTHGVHLGSSDE